MKNRTHVLLAIVFTVIVAAGLLVLSGCGDSTVDTVASVQTTTTAEVVEPTGPLAFPVDDYTVETKTITTPDGDKEVTCNHYVGVVYVEDPVDVRFHALNVDVPVEIDGVAVDASDAPIIFAINVGGYAPSMNSKMVTSDPALAYGYVVVSPACRGSRNQADDGTYFGKAPAAIVDLKAAVMYLHYNDAVLPGDSERIITTGTSAGGALSALMGTTIDQDAYDSYLEELGAADAGDAVFASACWCPITDLDHADMAYEWEFGGSISDKTGELVDQTMSAALAELFTEYQASLGLEGRDGFGTLTADNYSDYLLQEYLQPSADAYLSALSDGERDAYLAEHSWITWADGASVFTWDDYLADLGRMKDVPAFDDLNFNQPDVQLFGDATNNARHFTAFSLQQATGDPTATVDADLLHIVDLMNAMYFIGQPDADIVDNWWIRHGAADKDTALPIIINLVTSLENLDEEVNALLYWDAGHATNLDEGDFIDWVGELTGHTM